MIFINFSCPCPKLGCSNHGNCEECKKYHLTSNSLPFCKRNHGWFTKIFYRKNYELLQTLKAGGKV
ncbi:MAG: hypothetical protein ACFFAA_07460 [Promethearchaeota archaeon]